MTYCLAIKVKAGLVAISDTRITTGTETTIAKKISIHKKGKNNLFIMTSGLRSIRDKAVTYFDELIEDESSFQYDKMYKVVNAFGDQLRRVSEEDRAALQASGLVFNLFAIVGGRLENDAEHKLFLLYPEGNWIEIGQTNPFCIIGNSGYGKPILNRTINFESTLQFALKTGFLSFDSTRVSASDVGYPIDVAIFDAETGELKEKRFIEENLQEIGVLWAEQLRDAIKSIPDDWIKDFLKEPDKIFVNDK